VANLARRGRAQSEGARVVPRLTGRRHLAGELHGNGGRVAEMLSSDRGLLRDPRSARNGSSSGSGPRFSNFQATSHLIHGLGDPSSPADRGCSSGRSEEKAAHCSHSRRAMCWWCTIAAAAAGRLPSPGSASRDHWRCHSGWTRTPPPAPRGVPGTLSRALDHAVFSAPEYIPERLAGRPRVIPSRIDPLAPRTRPLASPD